LYSAESYLTHNLSRAKVAMSLALLSYKIEPKNEIIIFLKHPLYVPSNYIFLLTTPVKKITWSSVTVFSVKELFPDKNQNKIRHLIGVTRDEPCVTRAQTPSKIQYTFLWDLSSFQGIISQGLSPNFGN
jgi:hypothetical protein